jgi:hypothetical protein
LSGTVAALLPYFTGAGGAVAVLVAGFVLIQTGKLVPDRYHQQIVDEADKLRQANDTLRETLRMAQEQNAQLTSSTQLTVQVMNILERIAADRLPPADHG